MFGSKESWLQQTERDLARRMRGSLPLLCCLNLALTASLVLSLFAHFRLAPRKTPAATEALLPRHELSSALAGSDGFKLFADPRGWLVEPLPPTFVGAGLSHLVSVAPGAVRGNHRHPHKEEACLPACLDTQHCRHAIIDISLQPSEGTTGT